ncbi:MAG: hypothetical protein LRY51_12645, partial [Geovibrio sp.]|nr:hypothetical protein [Geovibrio sp.]
LTAEHSEVNIALKLVPCSLIRKASQGPTNIGLSQKRIERVFEDEKTRALRQVKRQRRQQTISRRPRPFQP